MRTNIRTNRGKWYSDVILGVVISWVLPHDPEYIQTPQGPCLDGPWD